MTNNMKQPSIKQWLATSACEAAWLWIQKQHQSPKVLYERCPDPNWLLWLYEELWVPQDRIARCALDIAELVLREDGSMSPWDREFIRRARKIPVSGSHIDWNQLSKERWIKGDVSDILWHAFETVYPQNPDVLQDLSDVLEAACWSSKKPPTKRKISDVLRKHIPYRVVEEAFQKKFSCETP